MEQTNKNNLYDTWCDMIEIDSSEKLIKNNDLNLNSKSQLNKNFFNPIKFNIIIENHTNSDEHLSIDEILKLDLSVLEESSILKHQSYIILQLKKHISNCKTDKNTFNLELHRNKLEWLLKSTSFLSEKRKLNKIKQKKQINDKTMLKRNSYEFCEKNNKCQYHTSNKCKKKHFVYNFIVADLEELINYLEHNNLQSIDEIFVSINTISYVINHMKDEIFHLNNK